MKMSCLTCRHRRKGPLQSPCSVGVYQMLYAHRDYCTYWELHWWQRLLRRILRR